MNEENYHVFFSYSQGVGPKTFVRLLKKLKTLENIYNATSESLIAAGLKGKNLEKYLLFKNSFDLKKTLAEIKKKKIWVLTYQHFPKGLKNISNPPIVLFGKGDKKLLFENRTIGIVGSRRPTSYGRVVTESFTGEFVENRFIVVSGMALGIDGVAHRSCLKSRGKTIAVLGSGVDLPTPAEHSNLYSEIIKNGGAVVSEFPLGMKPTKGSFPARNRIISALSSAILIPEATSDSGALITAKEAFSQGRKVFVVPGPITSSLSRGTNSLLSHGGIAVGSVQDMIQELGIAHFELRKNSNKIDNLKLNKKEMEVCKAIENESLGIDQISRITKINARKLMVILTDLELRNIVLNTNGRWRLS